MLLPPNSEIPMAVRLGTTNAEAAHARLRQAGARLHNEEVVHLDGFPPMFFFADPDGNGLVYLEEEPGGASGNGPRLTSLGLSTDIRAACPFA